MLFCAVFPKVRFDPGEKPLCNRRECLILFPDEKELRFKPRRKRSEHKSACRTCINQMVKCQ